MDLCSDRVCIMRSQEDVHYREERRWRYCDSVSEHPGRVHFTVSISASCALKVKMIDVMSWHMFHLVLPGQQCWQKVHKMKAKRLHAQVRSHVCMHAPAVSAKWCADTAYYRSA
jgi:hypothetical protein